MNKVICDICGTSYPETEEMCPICGYAREIRAESTAENDNLLQSADLDQEVTKSEPVVAPVVQTKPSKKFDLDDEDEDDDDDDEEEDEDEEDEKDRPSAILIILLVLVILALLGVAGFIFVKYYLPGIRGQEAVPTTTAIVETTEATSSTVPCTSLVMTSDGEINLEQIGNSWLIHVVAMPEDTTDEVFFASSDESVATVDASGKVTAVGEGTAVITVTCGAYQLTCDVTCAFTAETTLPDVTQPETETNVPGETEAPTEPETEPATEPATEPSDEPAGELKLTLEKTDITFHNVNIRYPMKVTEGINPADVEWVSTNGAVAFVVDGDLNVVGYGLARIIARYNGQEVVCVVRVSKAATSGNTTATTPPATTPATTPAN